MEKSPMKLLEISSEIKKNSNKTEVFNEVLNKHNVHNAIKSLDDLELNKKISLSTIRISSEYYEKFNLIKEDLRVRGISISSFEFFNFLLKSFFESNAEA